MAENGTGEYALVVATFYRDLADRLANGAVEAFSEHGVSAASLHTFVYGPMKARMSR